MAEGGETTTSFEIPTYDPWDNDFDDDDERGDETTPFLPNGASTPAPGGEEIEMQTIQHEKNGLPERSYAETSFGAPTLSKRAWNAAKTLFPDIKSDVEISYNTKGRLLVKMFGADKKLYNLTTIDKTTGREQINKYLSKEIKPALGKSKYEKFEDEELAASQKEKKKKEMEEKKHH